MIIKLAHIFIVFFVFIAMNMQYAIANDACSQYIGNPLYYNSCHISLKCNISIDDAARLYILALNERTAQLCGFTMTPKFYDGKRRMLKNNKYKEVYDYIFNVVSNVQLNTQDITDIKGFCRNNAKHLGGPSGLIKP